MADSNSKSGGYTPSTKDLANTGSKEPSVVVQNVDGNADFVANRKDPFDASKNASEMKCC